jgi:hypothetical protein
MIKIQCERLLTADFGVRIPSRLHVAKTDQVKLSRGARVGAFRNALNSTPSGPAFAMAHPHISTCTIP